MSTIALPVAARSANPWSTATKDSAAETTTSSRLIGETEFAGVYAAADFAAEFEMWMDTSVTISWSLLGVTDGDAVQAAFTGFTKCLRDWLIRRTNPVAFVFAHELGPVIGLHSHLNVFIAGARYRSEFRRWVRDWSAHVGGRYIPRAVRVAGPRVQQPWLHWLRFGYLMKGYDRDCVVQSGRMSLDGKDVRLGDLIPFAWTDPGNVTLKKRVGVSRSLGPDRRLIGVPTGFDYLLEEPKVDWTMCDWIDGRDQAAGARSCRTKPFRSKYEDGARDVRILYGRELVERVVGLPTIRACATNDDADLAWLASVKI